MLEAVQGCVLWGVEKAVTCIDVADEVLSIVPPYRWYRDWLLDTIFGPEDFFDDAPVTAPNSRG